MSANSNPNAAAATSSGNGCRTSTIVIAFGGVFFLLGCFVLAIVGYLLVSSGTMDAQALWPVPEATAVLVEPAEIEESESGPVLSPPVVPEVESTPTPAASAEDDAVPAEVSSDEAASGSEDEVDEASPMAEAAAAAEATVEAAEGDFTDEDFVQADENTYVINVGGHTYSLGVAYICEQPEGSTELPADDPIILQNLISTCQETGGSVFVRVWRMANEQYTVWTVLLDIACDQPVFGHLQWDNAFRLMIAGGETGVTCEIHYMRDLNASADALANDELDPYDQATEGSELGVGWFINGPSTVYCGDITLTVGLGTGDYSVVQLPFDRDEEDGYIVTISVEPEAIAYFLQGGVFTPLNSCEPETFNRYDPPPFALTNENGDPVSSIHGIR